MRKNGKGILAGILACTMVLRLSVTNVQATDSVNVQVGDGRWKQS